MSLSTLRVAAGVGCFMETIEFVVSIVLAVLVAALCLVALLHLIWA